MGEKKDCFRFCSAQQDSFYAIELLRCRRKEGALSKQEERQLRFMEKRAEESNIYLSPAVIYAAANQKSCGTWLTKQPREEQEKWYVQGVAWMKRYPAFLEKFGWKERRLAILAAGILSIAEGQEAEKGQENVRAMLQGGWNLLWRRVNQGQYLTAPDWDEMKGPWKESEWMDSAMSGVILLMAVLQGKSVRDLDRIWRSLQKLRAFTISCLSAPQTAGPKSDDIIFDSDKKINWLMKHFKNPQRPAYIREKDRISSEWLDRLFKVMEIAGLPPCTCETMALSCREVHMILEAMEDKMTERQYMTFLMLYAVSRELAQAGRAAAANAAIPVKR